jgi:hypothetical protein
VVLCEAIPPHFPFSKENIGEVSMSKHRDIFAAPELPNSVSDWIRKTKAKRSINDLVEDVHLLLAENAEYKRYMTAIFAEQSQEGSLYADDLELARMIRAKAEEMGNAELANEKKSTIAKALNIVLGRYELTRTQRRAVAQAPRLASAA